MKNREKFWVWGYILDQVPGKAMFVDEPTRCSLETGVRYMGCEGAFWMNSLHGLEALCDEQLRRLEGIPNLICGLTHIETNGPGLGGWKMLYREAAERISELSLKYPAVTGAVVDDFLEASGPSKDISPEYLHEVNAALKSKNPKLKLYVVQYLTIQDPVQCLQPFKDDIDGLSVWNWYPTEYFWKALYEVEVRRLRAAYPDKEIIQGQFIHDFGGKTGPMAMEQVEMQCEHICEQLDLGRIDGWCLLQSGFFSQQNHRRQAEYVRNFWNWYCDTRTVL